MAYLFFFELEIMMNYKKIKKTEKKRTVIRANNYNLAIHFIKDIHRSEFSIFFIKYAKRGILERQSYWGAE